MRLSVEAGQASTRTRRARARRSVLERQEAVCRRRRSGAEHVAHAVEGLVDDAVVVTGRTARSPSMSVRRRMCFAPRSSFARRTHSSPAAVAVLAPLAEERRTAPANARPARRPRPAARTGSRAPTARRSDSAISPTRCASALRTLGRPAQALQGASSPAAQRSGAARVSPRRLDPRHPSVPAPPDAPR